MTERKRVTRLSAESFSAILAELLAGPSTVTALCEASGMTHRYVNRLVRVMRAKKLVHIASFEKDAIGRNGVKVWALGPGTDARKDRANKPRAQVQRDHRAKRRGDVLKGTPFQGLPVAAGRLYL